MAKRPVPEVQTRFFAITAQLSRIETTAKHLFDEEGHVPSR